MRIPIFKIFLLLALVTFGSVVALPQKKEVSITSRPSAGYTDEAREKKIEGAVWLKIEFCADGTIGEVIDVTKEGPDREKLVKYGLSASAIEVAKKIKFKPAAKNGTPVTVKKVVMYQFTLY